ncbi:MAG: nuclear transport factor 2 family protein [Candidatus Thorarchaeota archaeon]
MENEFDNIKDTVQLYFDAVTNRTYESILESWHPEARMSFIREGEIDSVPRSFWENYCKQPIPEDQKGTCELLSVDIAGNAAAARTRLTRETPTSTMVYTDYLTLLRQEDGKWLIISKSFHVDTTQTDA